MQRGCGGAARVVNVLFNALGSGAEAGPQLLYHYRVLARNCIFFFFLDLKLLARVY